MRLDSVGAGWKPAIQCRQVGRNLRYIPVRRQTALTWNSDACRMRPTPFVDRAIWAKAFWVRASLLELLLRPRDFVSAGRLLQGGRIRTSLGVRRSRARTRKESLIDKRHDDQHDREAD